MVVFPLHAIFDQRGFSSSYARHNWQVFLILLNLFKASQTAFFFYCFSCDSLPRARCRQSFWSRHYNDHGVEFERRKASRDYVSC